MKKESFTRCYYQSVICYILSYKCKIFVYPYKNRLVEMKYQIDLNIMPQLKKKTTFMH